MICVYKNRQVDISWTIYKGQSTSKETFSRAILKVFAVSSAYGNTDYTDNEYVLSHEVEDGVIKVTIPSGTLPVGLYSLKAVWFKNKQLLSEVSDIAIADRSYSTVQNKFAVTDDDTEATAFAGEYPLITITSSVNTFGYDGLDSYELAVLNGLTILDRDQWVANLAELNARYAVIETAETGRVTAEAARAAAETARQSAETARASAETSRASAESSRATAETGRASAETSRVTAENNRAQNETERDSHETTRISQEEARETAEEARQTAEGLRELGESNREEAYTEAENARDAAYAAKETARDTAYSTAESTRDTTFAGKETARDSAYSTAEGVRNSSYTSAEETRQASYNNAEADRINTFNAAEATRQAGYTADHAQAGTDHSGAVSDRTRAGEDHAQAVADHSTASSDHSTATSDHSTASSDHTQAVSDSTTAGTDHTTAEADHVIAEADHTATASYQANFAPTYDSTTTSSNKYKVGDLVTYDGKLYRCITESWGSWDSSKWSEVSVSEITDDLENIDKKSVIDGDTPSLDSIIYDKYPSKNGTLTNAANLKTYVYNVSGISHLMIRWGNDSSLPNYGILFSNDATFATVSSFITPYTTTKDNKIIAIPEGVTYMAIASGNSVALLNGEKTKSDLYNQITEIKSNFNSFVPLTFSTRIVGYLNSYGSMAQTQSGSNFRTNLYAVTPGQRIYFKQDQESVYAYYGFCDDTSASHIISYKASGYNEFVEIVVPVGANYFMVNAQNQEVEIPSNTSCLGTPKIDWEDKKMGVYNYFPSYSLNEKNMRGTMYRSFGNNIVTDDTFKSLGTYKSFEFNMNTQYSVYSVPSSDFRSQFKTNGKIRICFDLYCSAHKTVEVRLYTWGASTTYLAKNITANNNIVHFDNIFQVSQSDINDVTSLELYLFPASGGSYSIKVANLIITDDIFDKTPVPLYSQDWDNLTRPMPYLYSKCIYIGDSISTANNYKWKSMVEDTYKIYYQKDSSGLNPANGGIKVRPPMADESSLPDEDKSIWYRCANNRMSRFSFDIINLFGGQNDKGIDASLLGTIDDTPYVDDASSFDTPANYTDTWSADLTFAQCYMGCIEMLKRDFPTKELLLMSVYPTRGDSSVCKDIAILQCEIAHKYGLKMTPLWWGIFDLESVDGFTRDGTHPNDVLARQMAIKFAQTLGL